MKLLGITRRCCKTCDKLTQSEHVLHLNGTCFSPGGGSLVFQAGYHPRKRTFKTHPKHLFFRYENRPWIYVFACIFLNFTIMSFSKFVNMTKNTPFFTILHIFAPLNDVRAYIVWSLKTTLITWIFFTRMISNFKYKCPPPRFFTYKR